MFLYEPLGIVQAVSSHWTATVRKAAFPAESPGTDAGLRTSDNPQPKSRFRQARLGKVGKRLAEPYHHVNRPRFMISRYPTRPKNRLPRRRVEVGHRPT